MMKLTAIVFALLLSGCAGKAPGLIYDEGTIIVKTIPPKPAALSPARHMSSWQYMFAPRCASF